MRALRVILFATSCFLASDAWGNDVCYKLNADALNVTETKVSLAPSTSVLSDRIWAAPGVEQTSENLLPPASFDFTATPRIRVVHLHEPQVGPEWLDDAAWPLTRELYGLGQPYYDGVSQNEYQFGLITLQR